MSASEVFAEGVVTRSFSDQESYDVTTDDGVFMPNCVFGAGFASGLLGFRSRGRLAQGTRVSVTRTSPGIIFACHSSTPPDHKAADLFRTSSYDDISIQKNFADPASDSSNMGSRLPVDMLEGEWAIDNMLGVGVHFLTTMAKLQAGDRAKVEVGLIDDVVRIVSGHFKHHSAIGDEAIYNDGHLNHVKHATSYPHEAAGVAEEKSVRAKSTAGVLDKEITASTGRWRYSHFMGYLGDFLHVFISDPVEGLAQLAQERAGKLHVHAGSDGGLLVRSVSDIVFERVSRISVPIEIKEHFHPDGKTAAEHAQPSTEHLDSWNFDPSKPWKAAYYLRDYARWLSESHAYARFLQNDKDWEVKAPSETPEPSYGNQEKDREGRMPPRAKEVRETYATFRLLRDGSFVVVDGYGSSWMMAGGDINASAARHFRFESGGHMSFLAGGSLFMKARKHIEISAVTGALLFKARQRLHALCEKGTILLRTLMSAGESTDESHRFLDNKVGVVISAPEAGIMHASGRTLTLEGQGAEPPEGTAPNGVLIQSSAGDITVRTGQEGAIKMRADRILRRARMMFDHAVESWAMLSPYFNMSDSLVRSAGKLYCRVLNASGLRARFITSATLLKGVPTGDKSPPPHHNHVGYLEDAAPLAFPDRPSGMQDGIDELGKTPSAPSASASTPVRPVFNFLPTDEYQGSNPADLYDQSIAQQIASKYPKHPAGLSYVPWDFVEDALQGEEATDNTPFPGRSARQFEYPSAEVMHRISEKAPADITATADKAKPEAFRFLACDLEANT